MPSAVTKTDTTSLLDWTILGRTAAGGAIGAAARYMVGQYAGDASGTIVVNILGAFVLGVLIEVEMDPPQAAFWRTGVLGAFTTYSTMLLVGVGSGASGWVYLGIQIAVGIAAAYLGMALVQRNQKREDAS